MRSSGTYTMTRREHNTTRDPTQPNVYGLISVPKEATRVPRLTPTAAEQGRRGIVMLVSSNVTQLLRSFVHNRTPVTLLTSPIHSLNLCVISSLFLAQVSGRLHHQGNGVGKVHQRLAGVRSHR